MKAYIPLLPVVIVATIFSGCTILKPTFEQSNQYVIEKTMDALDLGKTLKKEVPPKSTFVLRSIERQQTVDEPIIAMIEDQAIASLVKVGYKVLERDAHTIGHLVRESAKTLKVEEHYKPLVEGLDVKELHLKKNSRLIAPAHAYRESKLKSADYIISYRVLEVGIKYNSLNDGFQWSDLKTTRWWFPWIYPDEVERETMVRLMVRLQEVKTGRITYSQILQSKNEEILEQNVANKLKTYHYDFYQNSATSQTKNSGLFSSLFN